MRQQQQLIGRRVVVAEEHERVLELLVGLVGRG
jgi:hypothetical protein